MAKLHYKYSSMNAGKSIDLMRTAYNYEENGYKAFVIKSSLDTKGSDCLESRIGLKRKVDCMLLPNDSVLDVLKDGLIDVNVILIDEAQFLKREQVDDFYIISKSLNIPVLCYGLRTNFKMEFFEGSYRLFEIADELEEIRTLCKCGELARFVGRKKNGEFEKDGVEIIIDGTDNYEYIPLCGKCYLEKVKKINLNNIKKDMGK